MKKLYPPIFGMCLLSLLSACNTMEGLGRDIKGGGENLEESANQHKPN